MNCLHVWNDQLATVKGNKLLLQRLTQEDRQWNLSPVAGSPLTVKDCVCMNVVLDCTLGLSCLFLLTSLPGSHQYKLLEANFTEGCLATRCVFNCDEQTVLCVQLLDGPLVLLASAGDLILVDGNSGQQHIIAVTELVKEEVHVVIKALWAFSLRTDASVLVLVQLLKEGEAHWTCLKVQENGGYVLEKNEKCVPYEYGCIASCVESTESLSMSTEGQFVVRRQFYVGTSYRQVVVFEAGALLYCVALDAVPRKIVVLESHEERLSLAVLNSGGTCAAYKLTSSCLKEVGCWKDVDNIVSGNLAPIGHNQLLMLFKSKLHGSQDFIVTDLSLFSTEPTLTAADSTPLQTGHSSLADTVEAFQLRKHDGLIELAKLEAEIQRKAVLINSSLSFLSSLSTCTDMQSPPSDSDLMCILSGEVENVTETVKPRLIKVDQLWKRVCHDQLIVGTLLKNTSERPLSEVHCSLLLSSDTRPTESTSHIVWHSSLEDLTQQDNEFLSHFPSPAKRKRLQEALGTGQKKLDVSRLEPGQSLCVVSSARLVCEGAVGGTLVVCVSSEGGVCTVDVPVCVSVEEVLSKESKIEKSCLSHWKGEKEMRGAVDWTDRQVQDLAMLLAVRRISKIVVSVKFTSWTQLVSLMRRRLPLGCIVLFPSSPTPLTDTAGGGGPLDGVAVCMCPSTHSTAHIMIMHRCEAQLSLLVTTLKQILPSDIDLSSPLK